MSSFNISEKFYIKEKLKKHRINIMSLLDPVEQSYVINQLFAKNGKITPFNIYTVQ